MLLIKKPRSLGILFCFVIAIEVIYFWNQYAYHADQQQSVLRNDGDREVVQYIAKERTHYDRVIAPIFERLPLYYAFYTNNFDKSVIGQWKIELRIPKLDNVEFISDACPTKYVKSSQNEKILIVDNGNCEAVSNFKNIYEIKRKDSTLAYRLYKN